MYDCQKGWWCFWWKLWTNRKKVFVVTTMWNSVVKGGSCSKWETAKWPTRSSGFLVPKTHEWGPRILALCSHESSYSPFAIWEDSGSAPVNSPRSNHWGKILGESSWVSTGQFFSSHSSITLSLAPFPQM